MNSERKEYMLLFRGGEWHKTLSAEEMQKVAAAWGAWFRQCQANGTVVAGSPLERTGKVVSGQGGKVISDGPFAESKEAIGGYFLLAVDTMEEALAIAQQCPGLSYGAQVEVRPVMEVCPMMECAAEAKPELAAAMA